MDFFSIPTFREKPPIIDSESDQSAASDAVGTACPHFAGFMAVCLSDGNDQLGLHPFLTNALPDFEDVSLGGGSMDVRRVKVSSFPRGLSSEIFTGRESVIVKHPRVTGEDGVQFCDIALELQILRHLSLKKHQNIIDLLAVMYHDTGSEQGYRILPALVLEFAEYGSVKAYQELGNASSFQDKIDIAVDVAKGLEALHDAGVVHGDVKPSNLLVCKHATRKFIVKVSDFGFSMPMKGGRLIGSTEMYCAPEATDESFQEQYLPQMDMYSFGLTLWTVMGDASPFWSVIPEDGRSENVAKMKKSGMIAVMASSNVVIRMRNLDAPLLILCKVLFYSLQSSPAKRFGSMAKIVSLLGMLQVVLQDMVEDSPAPSQRLEDALISFRNMVYESGSATAGDFDTKETLEDLISLVTEYEPEEGDADFNSEVFGPVISQFMPVLFDRYITGIDASETPLLALLQMQLQSKLQRELAFFLNRGVESANDSGQSKLPGKKESYYLLVECAGLLHEPEGIRHVPENNPSHLRFYRDHEFVPEISAYSHILEKVPWHVQVTLVESLNTIISTSKTDIVKAMAYLSLACAYVNELGVQYDLDVAADYVVKAAHLGLERARTIYINVFCHIAKSGAPDDETLRTWLIDSAEAGNPVARRRLEVDWPADVTRLVQADKDKEIEKAGMTLDAWVAKLSLSQGPHTSEHTRRLLLWSIVEDNTDITISCLKQDPGLLQQTLENGETPLLTACRLGRRRIVEAMLQTQESGSLAKFADAKGVTPLHWLCSFEDSAHEVISTLLCEHGANPNALAAGLNVSLYEPRVFDHKTLAYTPLHWAILQNRLSAVDALVKRSADATFRIARPEGLEFPLSAFDLAVRQSHPSIVLRLLEEEIVQWAVDEPKPMVSGGPVHTRPLFEALRGFMRWARLMNNGVEFEAESKLTIKALLDNGATTEAVLEMDHFKMPAVFATAYHQCSADIMVSGLQLGFYNEIDASVGKLSSGGSAIFLAITHHDRAMFTALLNAGASLTVLDAEGLAPLQRAAKETDDVFFTEAILDAGIPVDPAEGDEDTLSAFSMAVYCGNFTVARYLYDRGADRDRAPPAARRSILGELLTRHTRNGLQRVKFLLSLPDRNGSDGFMEFGVDGGTKSAFHLLVPSISETQQASEITGIMASELLRKYHTPAQINNTISPSGATALATAAIVGNHQVARRLLEAGADANIPDHLGRTARDFVQQRYCFPETTLALRGVDANDRVAVVLALRTVNENTTELLGLLNSYDAKAVAFRTPAWFKDDPEYRTVDWVVERLREQALNQ
ncbi:hypothetical protein EDB81DRAFT_140385 [Dactylonectria macrodidyma]|uniref:Protein kinase domain-containing protein n=1 Tax=Dactylonectria macrodidyma TaxID=307937 RepID=A0A9P9E1Y0_9HYPO|nr:hypothetical protein EDB81DRAFT_140385 [Dactylonectria macrodidyma]